MEKKFESKDSTATRTDSKSSRTKESNHKPYYRRNHNKRNDERKDTRSDKCDTIKDQPTMRNDPSWYAISDNIGKAVGSIPFNRFSGMKEDLFADATIPSNITFADASGKSTPGVMAVHWIATCGSSTSAVSAVNTAARALYTYVRHQNSGHANYESADLMLYVLAMDQVYTMYCELVRMYKTASTYYMTNRSVPDLLLHAMRVDPVSLRQNLAQFRYGINLTCAKISAMCVPKKFDFFKKHALMASAVLADSSSVRGQFSVPVLAGYYTFESTTTGGGSLKYNLIPESDDWNGKLKALNDAIDVIMSDEDMNIMSGDILKAFGRENLYTLAEVDENATLDFVFDENLLAQIENSVSFRLQTKPNITQAGNVITFDPQLWAPTTEVVVDVFGTGLKYFNSHKDDPDWKDTLEWTRLSNSLNYYDDTYHINCGTELMAGYTVSYYDYSDNPAGVATSFPPVYTYTRRSTTNVADDNYLLFHMWSHFDWAPMLYILAGKVASGKGDLHFTGVIGDLKVYTLVDNDTYTRLNECAVMAELTGGLLKL